MDVRICITDSLCCTTETQHCKLALTHKHFLKRNNLQQYSRYTTINEPILIHYFINNNHIKEIHTTVSLAFAPWILQFYWFDKCMLSILLSYRMVIPPWKSLVPHLCIPPLLYLNPGNYWSWPCSFCFSKMSFINGWYHILRSLSNWHLWLRNIHLRFFSNFLKNWV